MRDFAKPSYKKIEMYHLPLAHFCMSLRNGELYTLFVVGYTVLHEP